MQRNEIINNVQRGGCSVSGNTALVGFSISLLVLISIWLWLNVVLIRRMRTEKAQAALVSSSAEGAREVSTSEPNGRMSGTLPDTSLGPVEPNVVVGQTPQDVRPSRTEIAFDNVSDTLSDSDGPVHNPEVYILERPEKRTAFNWKQIPFYIRNTPDSPFLSAEWMTALQKLSQDPNILGWIAFHGNTVGASDHRYDDELTEVLKSYRSMLERLRKEVGLTQVLESSIVGAEGKIWMFSGGDDIWFALFFDNAVNAHEIVEELLPQDMSATPR